MENIPYQDDIIGFLNSRIEDVMQHLLKTNPEYALASEKCKELIGNVCSISRHERDVTITAGDCADIREYLDQEFIQTAIMQQELYTQGYLDCVKLLSMLGVIRKN